MQISREQLIKPVLTVLGVGMLVLGGFAIVRIMWLGGAEKCSLGADPSTFAVINRPRSG
jgi:hypothetical protein